LILIPTLPIFSLCRTSRFIRIGIKDRHAKKELKKTVRGIRPIERKVEGRDDPEAKAVQGYCAAVRSALTDDGRPPLAAPGLVLKGRLEAVVESLDRVEEKRGYRLN
jgi:hypothetical protein